MLFLGRDDQDPLFLQVKEAQAVGARAVRSGRASTRTTAQRVVAGQRLMQAASDIFLGWQRVDRARRRQRDFYIRQLRDWKGSADVEEMVPEGMSIYGRLCGWTLARAHARSGDPIAIASYLGTRHRVRRGARRTSPRRYADQNERDYHALLDAIASGRIAAETGL